MMNYFHHAFAGGVKSYEKYVENAFYNRKDR